MATAPLPPLSASVTRILALTGFPSELKTKDIQAAFSDYDGLNGGFRIKWVDDTSLLLVFNDPGVAKRAYLQTILSPPPTLISSTGQSNIRIKPYDGSDAQTVIFSVNNRRNTTRGSISVPHNGHVRGLSVNSTLATTGMPGNGGGRPAWKNGVNGNGTAASMHAPGYGGNSSGGEGGSPTIPSLPSQPTLNSLISSSLPDIAGSNKETTPIDTAAGGYITPPTSIPSSAVESTPPRMGDSARRMVAAGLGMKHPGLTGRRSGDPTDSLNKAMGGIVIAE